MVILVGNYEPHARAIAGKLGLDSESLVKLCDYEPATGERPIMISTHGVFHSDSGNLTKAARNAIPIDYKVNIDAHADFGFGQDGSYARKIIQAAGFMADKSELDFLVAQSIGYDSHIRLVYEAGWLKGFAVLGLGHPFQELTVYSQFGGDKNKLPGNIVVSADLSVAREIMPHYGQWQVHLTVDVDVLKDAPFIKREWRNQRSTAPSLDEVLKAMKVIGENNKVVAFDVCGFSPATLDFSTKEDKAGLEVYQAVIETAQGLF